VWDTTGQELGLQSPRHFAVERFFAKPSEGICSDVGEAPTGCNTVVSLAYLDDVRSVRAPDLAAVVLAKWVAPDDVPGIDSQLLASGHGWSVHDVICRAGPNDRPFEERHNSVCIAAVTQGTFQYRTIHGTMTLAPGALLLGNEGAYFECGHAHGVGDRCISFHFAPDYFEDIIAAVPGARRAAFSVPRVPPSASLLPLIAAAEAARSDGLELEEISLRLAGSTAATLAPSTTTATTPSRRDEQRISEALRRIEAKAHEPISLIALARGAAMSPYHFLRTFRSVVGMTPHQFVLGARLCRAAVRLRQSDESVSAIAYEAGFNDLSTFNRRFRRIMGIAPTAYRRAGFGHWLDGYPTAT
jgi:AraC family transcriptional regulator